MLLTKREAGGLNYEVGFNKPLLCLAEIVPDVKDQLVWHVAAALRHLIAGHTETANVSVDNYLEKAASEVIANTNPDVHSASAAVAQALYLGGYLGSVALSAIFRNGDFRLFEAAISQLTSIDIRFVRRLIFKTGGLGRTVLIKEVGLSIDDALYIPNVTTASSQCIFLEYAAETISFQEVLSRVSVDVASTACAHWKRGRIFQSAIWDVKIAGN